MIGASIELILNTNNRCRGLARRMALLGWSFLSGQAAFLSLLQVVILAGCVLLCSSAEMESVFSWLSNCLNNTESVLPDGETENIF